MNSVATAHSGGTALTVVFVLMVVLFALIAAYPRTAIKYSSWLRYRSRKGGPTDGDARFVRVGFTILTAVMLFSLIRSL